MFIIRFEGAQDNATARIIASILMITTQLLIIASLIKFLSI